MGTHTQQNIVRLTGILNNGCSEFQIEVTSISDRKYTHKYCAFCTRSRVLSSKLALPDNVVVFLKRLLVDPLVKHCQDALLITNLHNRHASAPASDCMHRIEKYESSKWAHKGNIQQ